MAKSKKFSQKSPSVHIAFFNYLYCFFGILSSNPSCFLWLPSFSQVWWVSVTGSVWLTFDQAAGSLCWQWKHTAGWWRGVKSLEDFCWKWPQNGSRVDVLGLHCVFALWATYWGLLCWLWCNSSTWFALGKMSSNSFDILSRHKRLQ